MEAMAAAREAWKQRRHEHAQTKPRLRGRKRRRLRLRTKLTSKLAREDAAVDTPNSMAATKERKEQTLERKQALLQPDRQTVRSAADHRRLRDLLPAASSASASTQIQNSSKFLQRKRQTPPKSPSVAPELKGKADRCRDTAESEE